MTPLRTAVFPIAGAASSALAGEFPRALTPILDRPLIRFAIEEAAAAGCDRFVFVMRPEDAPLRRYVEGDPTSPAALNCVFVEQPTRRGLGDAVLRARDAVGEEAFAVILPDDLIDAATPVLAQMRAKIADADADAAWIAGAEVRRQRLAHHGVMRIEDTGDDVVRVRAIQEKPDADATASNFAVTGRYILPATVFDALERRAARLTGEPGERLELTDALQALIASRPVFGVRYQGERFDCGEPGGVVRATLRFALKDPALRNDALRYIRRMAERA